MKSIHLAFLVTMLLAVMTNAPAQQAARSSKSSSFKSGFSSQKSRPTSGASAASSARASFGSFGGSRAATPQQSDSALSRRLSRDAAQANALRTLDERRAADQAAAQARTASTQPAAPHYERGNEHYNERGNGRSTANQIGYPPAVPVIVQQGNSGVGNIIAGFLLGRAMSGDRAHQHAYPRNTDVAGPSTSNGGFFQAMSRILVWMLIVAIVASGLYFIWKFLRRGQAPSTANYTFER
jgi:hypothetical protein